MGVVRLFLAFAVFQSHIRTMIFAPNGIHLNNTLSLGVNGGYAVMFFFIVSGFLISYVLETKYSRESDVGAFYKARAIRIYPLWWCVWLFSAIIFGYALENRLYTYAVESRSWLELVTSFFLFGSDLVMGFSNYPKSNDHVFPFGLNIGWSLATEVAFYAIAPLLLRSDRLCIVLLVASGLLREIVNIKWPLGDADTETWNAWCYYFFPSTIIFFLMGHLGRRLYQSLPTPTWMGFSGLGVALLVCFIQDATYHFENANFYFAAILFAASLPAVFEATKDNKISNFLGDLTYPLYLTHKIVIDAMAVTSFTLYPVTIWIVATAKAAQVGMLAQGALISVSFVLIALTMAIAARFLVEIPASRAFEFSWRMQLVLLENATRIMRRRQHARSV